MGIVNSAAYRQLVDEDLEWLRKQPRTLERDHIEVILKWHIEHASAVIKYVREQTKDDAKP